LKFIKWAVLIAVLLTSYDKAEAQTKKGTFRDTIDNAFDISKFLLELNGFLPIISPITEPAVGYGAIGVGVYFISKEEQQGQGFQVPDIVGAGGGFRYLLARQLGLQMGMDAGRGPEGWAFYIIFGSAWLR